MEAWLVDEDDAAVCIGREPCLSGFEASEITLRAISTEGLPQVCENFLSSGQRGAELHDFLCKGYQESVALIGQKSPNPGSNMFNVHGHLEVMLMQCRDELT